jgi:hypothetical protein
MFRARKKNKEKRSKINSCLKISKDGVLSQLPSEHSTLRQPFGRLRMAAQGPSLEPRQI